MTIDLTRSWPDLPVAVVDFETTGVSDDARPVEVAAVRFDGGLPAARFSSLLNPGVPIPEAAIAVHGITDAIVAGAPSLVDVAGDLLRVCKGAIPCAYNAPFDRRFLHAQITGKDCPAFDPDFGEWADPLVIVRDADRYESGKGRHKLENVCARYGVEMTGAHRAEADALACGFLLWQLYVRGKVKACPIGKLLEHIGKRRIAQEADFAAYRARIGAV